MSTFRAYLVTPPSGAREFHTDGAKSGKRARELGGTAEQIELPATKAGLIPFLNMLEQEFQSRLAVAAGRSVLDPAPAADDVDQAQPAADNDDDGAPFDPRVLERQVDRLGELGEKGLDQLDELQAFGGVGASFSRGVHLLSIVAAGNHQLARLFLRQQRKGR